jgi:hypothetical protein
VMQKVSVSDMNCRTVGDGTFDGFFSLT